MCPTSVCLSTFSFLDSNSKMLCPIEFKLGREIGHHHSQVLFKIGVIPFVRLSVFCPFVCPSTFPFPDSNSKTLCPIEFKRHREIDHHHSYIPFEIGVIPSIHLSVFCPFVCPSTFPFPDSNSKMLGPIKFKLDREIDHQFLSKLV